MIWKEQRKWFPLLSLSKCIVFVPLTLFFTFSTGLGSFNKSNILLNLQKTGFKGVSYLSLHRESSRWRHWCSQIFPSCLSFYPSSSPSISVTHPWVFVMLPVLHFFCSARATNTHWITWWKGEGGAPHRWVHHFNHFKSSTDMRKQMQEMEMKIIYAYEEYKSCIILSLLLPWAESSVFGFSTRQIQPSTSATSLVTHFKLLSLTLVLHLLN